MLAIDNETIDPGWFSQSTVDHILVVEGKLKVEFERHDQLPAVLEPGDLFDCHLKRVAVLTAGRGMRNESRCFWQYIRQNDCRLKMTSQTGI
jgi:hypothetical protein